MAKIEKGVPIPDGAMPNPIVQDLKELSQAEVGDSIFFPVPDGTTPATFSSRMTSYISKVGTGWATQRRESQKHPHQAEGQDPSMIEGIRVWKKADLVDGVAVVPDAPASQ